jgi:hypothetical protein
MPVPIARPLAPAPTIQTMTNSSLKFTHQPAQDLPPTFDGYSHKTLRASSNLDLMKKEFLNYQELVMAPQDPNALKGLIDI